jgi:hypothetical protein
MRRSGRPDAGGADKLLLLLKDRAAHDKDWRVREAAVHELTRGWKDDPDVQKLFGPKPAIPNTLVDGTLQ